MIIRLIRIEKEKKYLPLKLHNMWEKFNLLLDLLISLSQLALLYSMRVIKSS